MFCVKCGSQLPDGALFCGDCGNKVGETPDNFNSVSAEMPSPVENIEEPAKKPKVSKKKLAVIGGIAVIIIAIALIIFIPSKFERVKDGCLDITGILTGSGDHFTIDTYPDIYENMDETTKSFLSPTWQEEALAAIQYANEEFGFDGSVYSRMMETSALMGRQSEENDKYRVSWTYHPDDGLEVTYEKK